MKEYRVRFAETLRYIATIRARTKTEARAYLKKHILKRGYKTAKLHFEEVNNDKD